MTSREPRDACLMRAAREPETAHTRSAAGVAVLIDASDVRDCVVRWAAEDAALHGEPLTLLMTLPRDDLTVRNPEVVRRLRKLKRHSAVTLLEHARCIAESAVGGGGSPWVTEQMIFAAPVDAMVSAAQRHRLVVVGRDSISGGMLRRSPRPVAVVPDDGRDRRRRDSVLLGVAGAPTPDDATAVAFDEASKRRVPLTVLQVGCGTARSNSGAGPDVRARLARWSERYPNVAVNLVQEPGHPTQRLLHHSRIAQLVVVGRRRRFGPASLAHRHVGTAMIHASTVPVIVVPDTADA
jgi:nucleotide-binding universal stress UspA family protein